MKFLSNIGDPKEPNAKMMINRRHDQTQKQAWQDQVEWLKDKIIGDPQATEFYTIEQLKAMGMVGVYDNLFD